MAKPRVLLITPSFKLKGGVTEFNKMLLKYSNCKITPFILFSVTNSGSSIKSGLFVLYDYVRFVKAMIFKNYNIVQVNPSLGKTSLLRDSLFVWIAKVFYKKVIVQWHGWNPDNENLLITYKKYLNNTLYKADHIRFLASGFRDSFVANGFKNKNSLGNTFIDDKLLDYEIEKIEDDSTFNILFLSTISINKGIYEALKAYQSLKEKYKFINFTIAGDGDELDNIKKMVVEKKIPDVFFPGYVSGHEKSKTFLHADVYFFPSHYEGMPTSVIEAMSFGIPVVCSSVGALPDFFMNEKMGFIIVDQKTNSYITAIEKLILDKELRNRIRLFNYNYANEHFLASKSVAKIDSIYNSLNNG
jgi:glycosyltransferase involved in cell wall biosynthesis